MSIRAMHWAMQQHELKAGPWRTLMFLADAANDEHNSAWLSIGTISRKSGTARSAIKGHIQELAAAGFIVAGNQNFVDHIPANKRPHVWQPNLFRGTSNDLRVQLPMVSGGPESDPLAESRNQAPSLSRGPESVDLGGRNQAPNQELEPKHLTHLPAQGDRLARAREATPAGVQACRQALHRSETDK